jgi:hypothetical protein
MNTNTSEYPPVSGRMLGHTLPKMENHTSLTETSSVTPSPDGLTAEQSSLLRPLIRQNVWQDFQSNFEQVLGFGRPWY